MAVKDRFLVRIKKNKSYREKHTKAQNKIDLAPFP
jgi:hypothetical protein